MPYIFRTNNLCRMLFGTETKSYAGNQLNALIEDTIGVENSDKYVIAQDPFMGGTIKKGKIHISVGDGDIKKPVNHDDFCCIGEIESVE